MIVYIVRTETHYMTQSGALSTNRALAKPFFSKTMAELSARQVSGRVEPLTENPNPK